MCLSPTNFLISNYQIKIREYIHGGTIIGEEQLDLISREIDRESQEWSILRHELERLIQRRQSWLTGSSNGGMTIVSLS